jgi:hypothetical protein
VYLGAACALTIVVFVAWYLYLHVSRVRIPLLGVEEEATEAEDDNDDEKDERGEEDHLNGV